MANSLFGLWRSGSRKHAAALALTLAVSAAQAPPWASRLAAREPQSLSLAERFPPPPGYRVDEASERQMTESWFAWGSMGEVAVTGPGYFARLVATRPSSPGAVLRYYLERLRAQGGRSILNQYGRQARLEGYIPGPDTVWIRMEAGPDADEIVLRLVVERAAPVRRWPVERDAIPGAWRAADGPVTWLSAAANREAAAARDLVATLSAAALPNPAGAEWAVGLSAGHGGAPVPAGLVPYTAYIGRRPYSQDCPTCPVTVDPHIYSIVDVKVNDLRTVVQPDTTTHPADGIVTDPGLAPGRPGAGRLRDGSWMLWAAADIAPFLPVTHAEYLASRERAVRARRDERRAGAPAMRAAMETAAKRLEGIDPASAREMREAFDETARELEAADQTALDTIADELKGLSADARRTTYRGPVGDSYVRVNPALTRPERPEGRPAFLVVTVPMAELTAYEGDLVDRWLVDATWTRLRGLFR